MSRPWYLLITVSAPVLAVTVASVVLCDIIWTYRQRAQAERLLGRARDQLSAKNGSHWRPETVEITILQDMIACHEIEKRYRRTARKRNNSPALSSQDTLT